MNPKGKNSSPPLTKQNSVRLDTDSIRELFDELDQASALAAHDPRRTHVRWSFQITACTLKIYHPGCSPVTTTVACRNLSSTGMSIIHSSFLHSKTRVVATLPLLSGQTMDVEGTIVRCSHVRGICHELGIVFKVPIDARAFINLDPFEEGFILEKVDPSSLMGTILYIDDSSLGQSLVRHFLRETAIRVRTATDFEEARRIFDEGVDLILCDYLVKGLNGADFIALLREQGANTPAIFITSDNCESTRAKFVHAQASAILAKPVSQTLMLRALAEFLLADKDLGVTMSTLPTSHPGTAMLDRFVAEIRGRASELEQALSSKNATSVRTIVLQIAGIAPTMGFPRLAQLAQEAERAINATMSVEESMPQVSRLMRLCREIRTKRAA
jgi:CheY-like chemotaxis protein/HPt (histidine-containing phosphotransfer) domain-containing protein